MTWLANHLLVPIITGIAVGVALRFAAIAGEVGQHDLRAEEINTDLNRWVRDRNRVLNAEFFHAINLAKQGIIEGVAQPPLPKELEGTRPGDQTTSGTFPGVMARVLRQPLHEYRDEASGKVREYRAMARSEGFLHRLIRWRRYERPVALELTAKNRETLANWRSRTIPVYGDPVVTVEDDPTSAEDAADIMPLEHGGLTWKAAGRRRKSGETS